MKRLALAFLVSLGIHVLAYALAFRVRRAEPRTGDGPRLTPYPECVTLAEVVSAETREPPGRREGDGSRGVPAGTAAGAPESGPAEKRGEGTEETAGAGGSGGSGRPQAACRGRYAPLAGPIARRSGTGPAAADSTARGRLAGWRSGWDFSGIQGPADAVGASQRKRSGLADGFKPQAPAPKPEKNPPRFDFKPSAVQVRAMATLYRRGPATQKDLYLELDPGARMTASLFDRELDFLVSKGFLTRKKISPQNLFTFITPLGAVPVEMSRLNRLNPVYEYRAQVDRAKLLAFLQSRETGLRDRLLKASARDTAAVGRALRECERNMAKLAEE
jgi:hypothetical protein